MMRTKRIFALLLAILMCAALLPAMLVSADGNAEQGSNAPAVEYFGKMDFEDVTLVPATSTAYGLEPLNGFLSGSFVYDGKVYMYNNNGGQAMFDINFQKCDIKNISESFTVSMQVAFIGGWTRENLLFGGYRKEDGTTSFDYIFCTGGSIGIRADDGNKRVALPKDKFGTIEYRFHKADEADYFDGFELWVDGVMVGHKTITADTVSAITMLRCFQNYDAGQAVVLDSFAIIKGNHTLYDAENVKPFDPNATITPPESPTLPTLPTVEESEKTQYSYITPPVTFDDPTTMCVGKTPFEVQKHGGVWVKINEDKGVIPAVAIVNGVMNNNIDFLDLQYFTLNRFKVREDFVLSFRFKPLVENLSCSDFIDWRYELIDSIPWEKGRIRLVGGKLAVDNVDCGVLPVDEFTLIEVAFHYDTEADRPTFDRFSVMVNGTVVKSDCISNPSANLQMIKHFRLFNAMSGAYEVDDLAVVYGNKSLAYALPYEAPKEEEKPVVTDAPTTTETPAKPVDTATTEVSGTTAKEEEETGGCASAVSGSAIALLAVVSLAGVAIRKKD